MESLFTLWIKAYFPVQHDWKTTAGELSLFAKGVIESMGTSIISITFFHYYVCFFCLWSSFLMIKNWKSSIVISIIIITSHDVLLSSVTTIFIITIVTNRIMMMIKIVLIVIYYSFYILYIIIIWMSLIESQFSLPLVMPELLRSRSSKFQSCRNSRINEHAACHICCTFLC